jgi:hypothetical protein
MSQKAKSVEVPSTSAQEAGAVTPPVQEAAQLNAGSIFMPPSALGKAPLVPPGAPSLQKGQTRKARKLTREQVALLPTLGREFQNSKSWVPDFGNHAPGQALMLALVLGLVAIYSEGTNAEAWAEYLKALKMLCTESFLGQLDLLRPMFEAAYQNNSAVGNTYPTLPKFLASRKPAAAKAHATRRSNLKKKKAEQAGAAVPPSGSATKP